MESMTGLRWRSKALKPIVTKIEATKNGNIDVVKEEGQPLSPAARMFHEPDFNVYIIAVMGCKTRIDPQVAWDQLPNTLLKHPRFSSLQVTDEKGVMRWIPTKADLSKHIIVADIPSDLDSPDRFLEDYLYNLSKTKIDASQPLWDLHLLNLKTSTAESVGIFRIHHSIGDGTSLISLLLACTRQLSDPTALPTIPVKKTRKSSHSASGFSRGLWQPFMAVLLVLRLMWNTLVDVVMFIATAIFLKDTVTPLKGPPGAEFMPRRFIFRTLNLDDMKFVKNAMNMTINDVALAVTQAGLSKYLNRRYGEINKVDKGATQKKNNLPKNIRLRSTLLINIRPATGIQALADMMEKDTEAKWGNWIGFVLLPFKIALRDDPLDYVREAKATINRKKLSLESLYTFSISEIFLKIFGIKTSGTLSHRVITNTTMCFSNLVGPLEEIELYGHPMLYLAPSSYGQPHALMVNFQSYVNQMTVVLSVEENTIPDPHKLCDDLEESLHLIKKSVQSRLTSQNH